MAEKEKPRKCGYCQNFAPMGSAMQGTCRVMPGKSFRGKMVMYDMDARDCPEFKPVEAVFGVTMAHVTQGAFGTGENLGADLQRYRVAIGGVKAEDDVPEEFQQKDHRLVWEKHEEEEKKGENVKS